MNNYPNNSFINFVHIPKCAGSTFRSCLIDPYLPKELINGPIVGIRALKQYQGDLQFLRGHFAFGREKYFPKGSPIHQREMVNLVALRDPLDQMISYYYYKIQVDEVGQLGVAPDSGSRHPILDFYRARPAVQNMQTRMVAGVHWASRHSPVGKLGSVFPRLMLQFACRNLTRKFDWIFFQDTADKDFTEFATHYDLQYRPSRFEKTVTKIRPAKKEISDFEKEALLKINHADQVLYERAKVWRGESALVSGNSHSFSK